MTSRAPYASCAILATLILAALPTTAVAGHRKGRDRADVDLDRLKAELRCHRGQWRLDIEYEVEIEDAWPGERFELEVEIIERDRGSVLRDEQGAPISIIIPLDCPADVDDDEVTYQGWLTERLPVHLLVKRRELYEGLRFSLLIEKRINPRLLSFQHLSHDLHRIRSTLRPFALWHPRQNWLCFYTHILYFLI